MWRAPKGLFITQTFLVEFAPSLGRYFIGFVAFGTVRCLLCQRRTKVPTPIEGRHLNDEPVSLYDAWREYEDRIGQFNLGIQNAQEAIRSVVSGDIPTFFICARCHERVNPRTEETRTQLQRAIAVESTNCS